MRNQGVVERVALVRDDRGGYTGSGRARRRPRSPDDRGAVRPQEQFAGNFRWYWIIMHRSTGRIEAAALTACSFDRLAFAGGEENPDRRDRCLEIRLP